MDDKDKKSGLGKDIPSIFSGLPEINNGREEQPVSGPSVEQSAPEREERFVFERTAGETLLDGSFPGHRQAVLGVDIGASSIKLVQLNPSPEGWVVAGWLISEKRPERDEGGLESRESIIRRVREAVEAAGLKNRSSALSFRGDAVHVSLAAFAAMPKKELTAAARLEAKRWVSFNLEKALVQTYRLTGDQVRPGAKQNHLIIAARREAISRALAAGGGAGLTVSALLPQAFAWKGGMAAAGEEDTRVRAVIDIGSDRTEVTVYQGEKIRFCRQFQTGGDDITGAIIRAGASFSTRVEISPEEAEKIKAEIDLIYGPASTTVKEALTAGQAGSMVRPVMERIVQESIRSLDYFSQLFGELAVDTVVLSGGGILVPGLERFFGERMRRQVVTFALPEEWKLHGSLRNPETLKKNFPRLSRAAALALTRKPEVNFVPAAEIVSQRVVKSWPSLVILAAAVIGFSYLVHLPKSGQVPRLRELVAAQRSELNRLQAELADFQVLEGLREELAERERIGRAVSARRPDWNGVFRELSRITPDRIILWNIYLIGRSVPNSIVCEGRVMPGPTLPTGVISEFLGKINASPYFREVEQITTRLDERTQSADFSFKTTLIY